MLARNALFDLLGASAAALAQRFFLLLADASVYEAYDSAENAIVALNGMSPDFHGETAAVRAPECSIQFVVILALTRARDDGAFVFRQFPAILVATVKERVQMLAQELLARGKAQEAYSGGVDKGAVALWIDTVNPLGGRIPESPGCALLYLPIGVAHHSVHRSLRLEQVRSEKQ
jgi:hypothetical protein